MEKELKKTTMNTKEVEQGVYLNKVYNVKKQQLTLSEYNEFLANVTSAVVDYENKEILSHTLETILKLFFAYYYLDLGMENIEENGGLLSDSNYEKYCNINFEDYKPYIAYNQFQSLLISIDKQLLMIEKQFAPTIENLIKSVTRYTDSMSETFNGVDIKDVLSIFGADSIQKLPEIIEKLGVKSTFNKIEEEELVEKIQDSISKEN